MIKVVESSNKPYAEVQVGMQWVDDEFNKECVKVKGDKCWIKDTWNSLDSDDTHQETTMFDIIRGDNCDILVDPKYKDKWYGKIYVNSAINLDDFYPDYWNKVLHK